MTRALPHTAQTIPKPPPGYGGGCLTGWYMMSADERARAAERFRAAAARKERAGGMVRNGMTRTTHLGSRQPRGRSVGD